MTRNRRPDVLDDPEWLADQYQHKSAAQIARDLDINPQMVLAALRRQQIPIRSRIEQLRRRNPLLHDRDQLEQRVAATSVEAVATELGVTVVAVQAALARNGGHSAHRYDGPTRLAAPDAVTLEQWWQSEGTIKGVARRGSVSVNTAVIWLARAGIFVHDAPAISRSDLLTAIKRGDSINEIRRRHRVTDRTVVVELHRHGLHQAHRRRHMRNT